MVIKHASPIDNRPWYRRFRENFSEAIRYFMAMKSEDFKKYKESYTTFDNETKAQFIFESNNIEKEGLSRGETQKLVFSGLTNSSKNFSILDIPIVSDAYQQIKELTDQISSEIDLILLFIAQKREKTLEENAEQAKKNINIEFIARYGPHNREAKTVVQHFISTLQAELYVQAYRATKFENRSFYLLTKAVKSKDPEIAEKANQQLMEIFPNGIPPKQELLLSEEIIKRLHNDMAKNLIGNDCAPAGNYRTHPIMTDIDSHYPAPEAIPDAMKRYIEQFTKLESGNINPIYLASWASTQLVLIHPFSDFNGRISRLIMNMILKSYGLPFWVSMKSSSIERRRYFTSLKLYRRGNVYAINSLLAKHITNYFQNLNDILSLSDIPLIQIDEIPECPNDWNDKKLLMMNWRNV